MNMAMMNHDASVSQVREPLAAIVNGTPGIAKPSKGARAFTYGSRDNFGCRNELIPHPLMISLHLP